MNNQRFEKKKVLLVNKRKKCNERVMMMEHDRILLSTWFGPGNYGTALQALALKHYLEEEGYRVTYLEDYRMITANESKKYKLKSSINTFNRIFIIMKIPYKYALKKKDRMQKLFLKKHTNVAKISSKEEAIALNKNYDIFISGGDQIWNPYATNPGFMLDFVAKEKRKFSYGTSVGVKTIPDKYRKMYKKYLSEYHDISVREAQSASALQTFLKKDITVVLDPTLLFSGEDWSFLMGEAKIHHKKINKPYILVYFVGTRKSYWKYVSKIKTFTRYRVIVIPINDEAFSNFFKKYVDVSPSEFLWLIYNAEIVCTDSFHATVFSILFGKEFYVVKRFIDDSNESQNGRLENLLSKYGLSDRLIEDENCFIRQETINYKPIYEKIEQEREFSKQWLKNALKG